jgi:O-antigen/teichoic acid export membrane protein
MSEIDRTSTGAIESPVSGAAIARPARLLVVGRAVGFAVAFLIPLVLARVFDQATFGAYKQLFLVYATLFGLAQLGMAESLYYFTPRHADRAGRYVANALMTLAVCGAASMAVVPLVADRVGGLGETADARAGVTWLGVFLALMLPSAMFEIVLIARRRCAGAACAYAASDVARTLLLAGPAIAVGSLRGLMAGAVTFAALRFGAMLVYFWREFGGSLRPDLGAWRTQLAYALPFALAVSLDVLQINLHQYVVAARFDAAAFAVYAVGCLQIPLVDVIVMSHANVMMVRLAERADAAQETLAIWHGTVTRLALVIFPLAVLLVIGAREIITVLFTTRYLASVPIFMLWSLSMLPAVFCVDSMLRALAQTRFLFVLNLVRLVVVAVLVGPLLSAFGMRGAVLVSLLAATVGVGLAVRRIARLTQATAAGILPWGALSATAAMAVLAGVPALWFARASAMPPLVTLAATAGIYGAGYIGLWYLSAGGGLNGDLAALAFRRRLAAWLTEG